MPASYHRPKVARCVQHVMDTGKDKGSAIPICQASIGESYRIPKAERQMKRKGGKPLKALRKQQAETKAAKLQARHEKMGWNVARLVETLNGFCPTGQGGGHDNSCHGAGGKLNSKADERRRKLRWLHERYRKAQTTNRQENQMSHVQDLIEVLNATGGRTRFCNKYGCFSRRAGKTATRGVAKRPAATSSKYDGMSRDQLIGLQSSLTEKHQAKYAAQVKTLQPQADALWKAGKMSGPGGWKAIAKKLHVAKQEAESGTPKEVGIIHERLRKMPAPKFKPGERQRVFGY